MKVVHCMYMAQKQIGLHTTDKKEKKFPLYVYGLGLQIGMHITD